MVYVYISIPKKFDIKLYLLFMSSFIIRSFYSLPYHFSDMSKMVMSGGKHEIKWEEGKMVLIDDSFEHEVNMYNTILYLVFSIFLPLTNLTRKKWFYFVRSRLPPLIRRNFEEDEIHITQNV